jgi:NADH-quinone oxidoreductase subunit N
MLAGYAKRDGLSTEGAIKYFLLGSFSSAISCSASSSSSATRARRTSPRSRGDHIDNLLGQLHGAGARPVDGPRSADHRGGIQDRRSSVPLLDSDAYQGSPTPVTGYLSVGPKVAAFALILRVFVEALGPLKADWTPIVVILAAATMTLGNIVALTQDNIKRMLAYSSIAHTGYILVGLAAFGAAPDGSPAEVAGLFGVLFYSVAYSFMNLGAFACVPRSSGGPG